MKERNTSNIPEEFEIGKSVYLRANIEDIADGKFTNRTLAKRLVFGHVNFYNGDKMVVRLILEPVDKKPSVTPYKFEDVMTEKEAKEFLEKEFKKSMKDIFGG